jgi:hypothetical protein
LCSALPEHWIVAGDTPGSFASGRTVEIIISAFFAVC